MERKWTYWHKIIESKHPKFPIGNIVGLNSRVSTIHMTDESNPKNWEGLPVKFKFIGKLPKTENKKQNYIGLIKLCQTEKVDITKDMKRYASKNNIPLMHESQNKRGKKNV